MGSSVSRDVIGKSSAPAKCHSSPHKSQESSRLLSISLMSVSLCEHKLIRCGAQDFREIDFTPKFGRVSVKRHRRAPKTSDIVSAKASVFKSMPSLMHDPLCLRNVRSPNYLRTKTIKTTLRPQSFFPSKTQAVKFV